MSLAPELIAQLKSKHTGELRALRFGADHVVVRTPTEGEFTRFLEVSAVDARNRPAAIKELALCAVVHPDRAAFETLLSRKPGIIVPITQAVTEMAGADRADDQQKL